MNIKKHIVAYIILLFIASTTLWQSNSAFAWEQDGSLITNDEFLELKLRFPELKSPQDRSRLLREVTKLGHFSYLELEETGEDWVLRGRPIKSIKQIKVDTQTLIIKSYVEPLLEAYIGVPDAPEYRQHLLMQAKDRLARKGFLKPTFDIHVNHKDDGSYFTLEIQERVACRINEVVWPYNIPKEIETNLAPGTICEMELIEAEIIKIKEAMNDLGYSQASLNFKSWNFSDDLLYGSLTLSGSKGKIIRFKILDKGDVFQVRDLLDNIFEDELNIEELGPGAVKGELIAHFRREGYIDVEVSDPIAKEASNDIIEYQFTVEKGKRYVIGNTLVEGVRYIDQDQAIDILRLESLWNSTPLLNLEGIREGVESLKSFYQKNGFWRVKINDPRISRNPSESSAQVVIIVEEGDQRFTEDLSINGNEFFSSEEIIETIDFQPQVPFDLALLDDAKTKITEKYLQSGFLHAVVEVSTKKQPFRGFVPIDVIVDIKEGNRVKVGDITISGLTSTHPKVVRRELLFDKGDWYDPATIDDTRRVLTALGIFRSVQIVPQDSFRVGSNGPIIDLEVKVAEGRAGQVIFGPGYARRDGFQYAGDISYNNIGGLGRQVNFRTAFSEEKDQSALDNRTLLGRRFSASYLEPWILDYPVNGTLSGGHKAEAENFWKLAWTGEVALSYKLGKILPGGLLSAFYGQKLNLEEGSDAQVLFLVATGNVRIGRVGLRLDQDARDDVFWPTKGYFLDTEFSWARFPLGGELRYFRWDIANNWYLAIDKYHVFAFGVRATAFENVTRKGTDDKNNVLPASERLQAGGTSFVRGFRKQLGPFVRYEDPDNPGLITSEILGGTRRLILKAEIRRKFAENHAVSLFSDSGNSFFSAEEMKKFDTRFNQDLDNANASVEDNIGYDFQDLITHPGYLVSRHYLSFGTGYSYLTPIGSVNIAYAWPWKEPKSKRCQKNTSLCLQRSKKGDRLLHRGAFEFNIGAQF